MRPSFRSVATLLWPSAALAFALPSIHHSPSPSPSPSPNPASSEILSVKGWSSDAETSIRFETPCHQCFVGINDHLIFDFDVFATDAACGTSKFSLNGIGLTQNWDGDHTSAHGILKAKLANGLGEREIHASWQTYCIHDDALEQETAQVVVLNIHKIGQNVVTESSGFTLSYKPQGRPEILRLVGEPIDVPLNDTDFAKTWINPLPAQRLSITAEDRADTFEPKLEQAIRELQALQAQSHDLHRQMKAKKNEIHELFKEDFRSWRSDLKRCGNVKCVWQVWKKVFRKFPKIARLVSAALGKSPTPEIAFNSGSETDVPDASMFLDAMNVGPPPPGPTHHHEPPSPPDTPPFPPHQGKEQHPPPPLPPPPPHRGHGHYGHGPPLSHPHHHHGPPHRFVKHLAIIVIFLVAGGLLFRFVSSRFSRSSRADRAFRCEERRNRRAYRRAARHHQLSKWWSRYRLPRNNQDYEEKRQMIIDQEGVLERAMQDEIRGFRVAQEIMGEIAQAEEGRSRLYRQANMHGAGLPGPSSLAAGQPAELDTGLGMRPYANLSRVSSLPSYHSGHFSHLARLDGPPPPNYEEELEGDMTVVDGFQYTPSATGSTPASSIIDCSPRLSVDTGRTTLGPKEDRDLPIE